jgi:two-component system response regulator FixJ
MADRSVQGIVYIVDNDRSMRGSLTFLVESVGWTAASFESAEAFLAVADPERAGCLVLDVRLPGMSGIMLQEELEERGVPLPIIMISGFGDVETAVRVLKRGAFDFIEKPFAPAVVLDRIAEALALDARQRRLRAERQRVAERLDRLTARERAVFDQVVQGKANKVVAYEFGISEKTVEAHRARVMHKLGATSVAELVRMDFAASQFDWTTALPVLPFPRPVARVPLGHAEA